MICLCYFPNLEYANTPGRQRGFWLLAFAYICGLVNHASSANQNAKFSTEAPFLQQLLSGEIISQSAFSRFLSKPFEWLRFSLGRIARLQENMDSRLTDGDIIALDDTKVDPYGKKIPFLCWLFDSSDKRHVWCINLVSTLAVLKNGFEYPMLWRFWVKYFFNAGCRIRCNEQQIQVYFDTATERFARLIDKFWP